MPWSNSTVAQPGHQFVSLAPENDPDVVVFSLTLQEDPVLYLAEDVYPSVTEAGLPR